ncbi:formate dehydrogenase accessory sulfurtransferase FdhD [Undibacterium rugosum]|nr:formate dehydrogenase accessory sulfurtransferase FdhD [Undibacterium rugosum]
MATLPAHHGEVVMQPDQPVTEEVDGLPPSLTVTVQRVRYAEPGMQAVSDQVAQEVPVALVYNGISHAVMMASPSDLEDFARGFSLSEGVVSRVQQIYDIRILQQHQPAGLVLEIQIAAECVDQLKRQKRQLAGRTGCGLCGIDSLAALPQSCVQVSAGPPIPLTALQAALRQMPALQVQNAVTGALHAAAFASLDGQITMLREDVGRHNALDKLTGALAQHWRHVPRPDGFVLLSSRASYELVQKTAVANIRLMVCLSAPTALALQLAQEAGICLIGFARHSGLVIYTHPEAVLLSDD